MSPRSTFGRSLTAGVLLVLTTALAACGSDSASTAASSAPKPVATTASSSPVTSPGTSSPGAGSSTVAQASGSDKLFCSVYNPKTAAAARTNLADARTLLERVSEVAPAAIKADAELLNRSLLDVMQNKTSADVASKVRIASVRVSTYYSQHCR